MVRCILFLWCLEVVFETHDGLVMRKFCVFLLMICSEGGQYAWTFEHIYPVLTYQVDCERVWLEDAELTGDQLSSRKEGQPVYSG